jgi:DNA-binding NarL/FixJ family response regulator
MNPHASRRLNILVMHHDPIVCAGLVASLHRHAEFELFVHGPNDFASSGPPFDVVIADHHTAVSLADRGTGEARGRLAESRVLALTANDREADIRRAIQTGVRGYLLLGGSLDELAEAIRVVGSGMRYLCPSVAQRLADSLAGVTLTLRENEVLRLVATGQSNKEIARQLVIELGTVKSHVSAIMTKLGAASRTQAASIAASRGLVADFGPLQTAAFSLHTRRAEVRPRFA